MNRKDRRAAGKRGKGPLAPMPGAMPGLPPTPAVLARNLFAAAVQHFRAGQIAQAERACRDVLTFDRNHADALHLLGVIAFQVGRHDAALELIGKALALNGRNPDCHFNMAQVLRTRGLLDEAAMHFTQATELRPDYAAAHLALADFHLQQGRFGEAVSRYRRALMNGGSAEAHGNFGVALAGVGLWEEAAAQYRRALALNPSLVDVYRNLARIMLVQGNVAEALALTRRALALRESDEVRALFVQCLRRMRAADIDGELRGLLARALSEGWSRPSGLSALAGLLCGGARAAAELAGDALLRALLESTPVRNIELERVLTAARSELLTLAASSPDRIDDRLLGFFCALARQCFINEYVFALSEADAGHGQSLRGQIAAAIETGADIPPLLLVAVAAVVPLHSLPRGETLLQRSWPAAVGALLEQQVREPAQEREIRASVPALTAIDDEVSLAVQHQYEAMPYPRWIKAAPVGQPVTIEWYLRNQFPTAPIRVHGPSHGLDVLIPGCGTGQHTIETAQRFAGARVLAVDLSRTSLGYAIRKTQALGLRNIEYAQADILKLGALGRTFDLIEVSGVLHHLRDWAEGWRVLLALLQPGGFMHVGLYSAAARADIRAARAFIAERHYGYAADDIRRCRQELLGFEDGSPLKNVAKYPDFFTISECRDLLFHVQEHQLTIPEIAAFLRDHRLTFIGFTGEPALAYRQRFPADAAMTDLEQWHQFETENPLAFTGMYQFWVQKA
jgi:Flp pilus assembly protein TadD/SAM-dependent methyltransferase